MSDASDVGRRDRRRDLSPADREAEHDRNEEQLVGVSEGDRDEAGQPSDGQGSEPDELTDGAAVAMRSGAGPAARIDGGCDEQHRDELCGHFEELGTDRHAADRSGGYRRTLVRRLPRANHVVVPSNPLPPIAELHPQLVGEWHPWMNGELTPKTVSASDARAWWWACPRSHPYQTPVRWRTMFDTACPVCDGKRVRPGVNDLATLAPDFAAEWDAGRNPNLEPTLIHPGYKADVWWRPACGHSFPRSPSARQQDPRCPVCVGRQVFAGQNDLASQRPDLAAQWHPERNGAVTADQVSVVSQKRGVWLRPCGHSYRATVAERIADPIFPSCKTCNPKQPVRETPPVSTRPELMALWDEEANAGLDPSQVLSGDSRRVIAWRCAKGHTWTRPPVRQRGYCRICANQDFVPGINDLATRNPALAQQWHPSLRAVGGRIKSDLRFNKLLSWNTFPLPDLSPTAKEAILAGGAAVLRAREGQNGISLADMYPPAGPAPALQEAHDELDRAVDAVFGVPAGPVTELERQDILFERYVEATAGLLAPKPGKRKKRTAH